MNKNVLKYVKSCPNCQTKKGSSHQKPVGLLKPTSTGEPFERLGIDILGPFPRNKYEMKMVVIATDYAIRGMETQKLPDGNPESIAKFRS